MQAKWSHIIPCHNITPQREVAFTRAIHGLWAQENPNWECLLVQDNECLNDAEFIRELVGHDDRFKYYHSIGKVGPSMLLNAASELTTSPLLHFHDQDDYILPQALNRLLYEITVRDSYLVTGRIECRSAGRKVRGKPATTIYNKFISETNVEPPTHLGGTLWTKKFFQHMGGFPNSHWGYDFWLLTRAVYYLAFLEEIIPFVDEVCYVWERNQLSYSSQHAVEFDKRIDKIKQDLWAVKPKYLEAMNHDECADALSLKNYITYATKTARLQRIF